jgi:hypothetical protein
MTADEHATGPKAMRSDAPRVLIVFAILFALFFFRALPLELDATRAANTPEQFDATRAMERLARVLDGTPHPVDSPELDATRARLLAEIRSLGYEPEIHVAPACRGSITGSAIRCATVSNIVFRAGPQTGPALVLTAHYDSVEASPGFGDDGIGVAVWLEVAHYLKQNPPDRPVVFLITDGEEIALLGAQAFVNASAHNIDVGRIINLEARGVRGPAMMFETSHPNAAIVSDWAKSGARPFANSMMAAVYELLPNSTDLTVHLEKSYPGINIAIGDGLEFYHTPGDALANIDRRSVQHMGDQALGATRAFLASDWSGDKQAGAEIAYSDFASRFFISLPQTITLGLLGLCFGLAALFFMRPAKNADWKHPDWRALALPPAIIVAAGVFAWLSQQLLALIRPEPVFWMAYPQAMNAVYFIGVLIAGALALAFVAPKSSRATLFASGWLWFLVVGLGLSFAVPGFSMVFLIPAVIFIAAAVVAWLLPLFALIAYAVAGGGLILIFFPMVQLIDVMMGPMGLAAVFGVVEALVVAPVLALAAPLRTGKLVVFGALGVALVAALIAAAVAPAFSKERPLALNFVAHYDKDAREAELYASASPGALPAAVSSQLTVAETTTLPGVTTRLASRKLNFTDRPHATASVVSDTPGAAGERTVTLQLSAPGARMVRLRIPAGAYPRQLQYGPNTIAMREPMAGYYIVDCNGRACDGAQLTFTLKRPADATTDVGDWLIQGYWLGLPPDAAATAETRPDTAIPIQMGDVTITTNRDAF